MHKLLIRNNGVNKGTFYETEETRRQRTDVVAQGRGVGREGGEFEVSRRELLYIRMDKHKVLLHNTGNYSQNPVISHSGKEYEKKCIHV